MRRPTDIAVLQRFWAAALVDQKAAFDALEDQFEPQVGFYRIGKPTKGWKPFAIWMQQPVDDEGFLTADETLIAKVRNWIVRDENDIHELWFQAVQYPVTYEAYCHAMKYGTWADDKPPKEIAEPTPYFIASELPPLF
jgi:hypothetical protein